MKNVSKYVKLSALFLALALPLLAATACTALKPKLDAGIAAAQQIDRDAGATIAAAKATATTLPVDDATRKALEAKIAQVQAIQQQVEAYINAAQGAEKSLDTGTVDPALASVLGAVPYGSTAVSVVSLVLMFLARAKASGTLTDLENVVKSWEAVGGPTDQQKPAVAAVQGPATSAVVDSLKPAA